VGAQRARVPVSTLEGYVPRIVTSSVVRPMHPLELLSTVIIDETSMFSVIHPIQRRPFRLETGYLKDAR
jgi:hypothetical protein